MVGCSFIAYELAEGIAHRGNCKVTWIMRGPWFLHNILDAEGGPPLPSAGRGRRSRLHQ